MNTTRNKYLERCHELASIAAKAGDSPVGAILVHASSIIGEGIESAKQLGDITCHAEIEAVRDAIKKGHKELLASAAMYTTHEPCVMCSYVLRHYQIKEIYFEHKVTDVGGYSSTFPILSSDAVPKWGNPPAVICLEDKTEV